MTYKKAGHGGPGTIYLAGKLFEFGAWILYRDEDGLDCLATRFPICLADPAESKRIVEEMGMIDDN